MNPPSRPLPAARPRPPQTEPIRVLVVEDHLIVRIGLTTIINDQPDMRVRAEAASAADAERAYAQGAPDVTLMDLRLAQGSDGVSAIRAIRRQDPHAVVVALSTYEGDEYVHQAVRAGACGYLLKSVAHGELVDVIRVVHGGGTYFPASVLATLTRRLAKPDLSPREMDVLRLLAKGLTNKEIGSRLAIAEDTVKARVKSITAKLGVTDRTQATAYAWEHGLLRPAR